MSTRNVAGAIEPGSGRGMTMTGWCAFPSPGSHEWCRGLGFACSCPCHDDPGAVEDPVAAERGPVRIAGGSGAEEAEK